MAQLTRSQFGTENRVRGHLGSGKAPPCGRLGGVWARGAGGQDDLPRASEPLGVLGPGTEGTWELVSGSPATLVRGYRTLWAFLGLENFSRPSPSPSSVPRSSLFHTSPSINGSYGPPTWPLASVLSPRLFPHTESSASPDIQPSLRLAPSPRVRGRRQMTPSEQIRFLRVG